MRHGPSPEDLALLDPDGSFRTRLEEDRVTLVRLRQAGDVEQLARLVHRLAGAAATFGYADIGDMAIALDDAFIAAAQSGGSPPDVMPLLGALGRLPPKSA